MSDYNVAFEWNDPKNKLDEQVSVVVRMSPARARVLGGADPVAQAAAKAAAADAMAATLTAANAAGQLEDAP
jgi:hypothetical protein